MLNSIEYDPEIKGTCVKKATYVYMFELFDNDYLKMRRNIITFHYIVKS